MIRSEQLLFDQIQQTRQALEKLLTSLQSTPRQTRTICLLPYQSRTEYRWTLRKGLASRRQGNRAMRNRQLPDCREHGLQGRISPVEAPAKAFYYIGEMTTTTQLGSPSISAIVCSCPTGSLAFTSSASYGREGSVGERTRPLFRPLKGKQGVHTC